MSSKINQYASFLKTHFVDLPKLFGFIKIVQRGELYHVLHLIAKEYHSNWDGTLSMNTYNDCRKLVNLFKIYNVKHNIPKIDKYERRRKFITNMFTTLRRTGDIAEKIDGTVEKVDTLINKLNSVVDTSHHDIKKIFSNISTFTDMFVPSGDSFVEIISYIVKFASFAYLLSQEQNRSPSNILALLVLILPTGVGDCVISSLSRAIQGIWTKFRAKDTMIANSNQDDGTIVAFFKVTLQLIQTLFTNISLEKFRNMQISVAKIKMIADYLKNSTTIFEYIMKLFQKCIEIAGNKILKYYGKLPKILQEETLNELIDKYVEIKENQYDIKAKSNSYYAKMVVDVYNNALQAQAKMIKSSKKADFGQSKLLAYLNIVIKNLEPIIQKIPDHVKGTKNARRTKPFWIYIFGEPRIGKTSMFQPYIVNAVSRACGLIEKYKDYSEYTYFRNCGDEYWEKYCGQPVLWYNDLFQVFTNEQKVNIGIEELTNVVDDNLYPLNMAFEEKHNVYFDSQLVISNAQKDIVGQTFVTNKCLSEGTHINARRNLVCRLRVDAKYKQCGGLNYDAMADAKNKGVPHVGDLFPKDMYLVDFMDPLNGSLIKTVYFEEAIMIIINCFKNYKEHQDKFKEKLFDHFEKMWQTNANDTFEDAQYDLNNPATRAIYDVMCEHCEIVYQHTTMLNELERQEIKKTLIENCVHRVKETFSRWREFGAKVKENIKTFWGKAKEFCKSNWKYMILGFIPVIIGMVRNYFQDTWIATSAEGNIKAPKTRIVRSKNNNNMVTNAYSQQNTDVEYKILKNMAFITLTHPEAGTTVKMGSVLGIGGDLFLIPRHFYVRFQEINEAYGDNKLVISLNFSGYQEVSMLFVDIKEIKVDFEHLADLAFIQFPKMICLSKIDKFFVTTKDEPVLYGSYLYGKRVHTPNTIHSIPVFNAYLTSREYDQPGMEIQSLGKYIPSRRVVIPEGYEFRLNGIGVGDCGMVLLNTDERMNARKIMAMHVAGTIDGNSGCAATIYQEDILAAYEAAGIFIAMGDTEILPVTAVTSVLKTELDGMFYNLGAPPVYKGKKVKLSIPMKTKISKSVFFDMLEEDLGPHQTIPAKLRPFEIDGKRISPLLLGLKKLTRTIFPIQEDIRKVIYEHMSISLKSWHSPFLDEPRLLTMDETLNGMKGLNKLDINTSPGYPFILQRNDIGKKQWFNIVNDKLVMTDELKEICDYRENMAKQGIIVPAYFIDTLKDETRPIKKVLQGKTRVFQVGPMDLSILMRKYFGYFLAHCQNTYIDGEMGVGINPNSYDWTMLFKRLKRVSSKFINGDYENYDSSLIQIIMRNFSTIVEDFYVDAPPEDRLVREVLLATVVNNYHIVEDYVYRIDQGNMSGIVMTSIVNCLFNMFLIRYAYVLLVDNDLINFHRDVSCTFYGDDNLVAVSERIIDRLNMVTYKNVMASIGINYTTPDKTDDIPLYYNETEVSYLKRKFVCKNGIYYAQLDMNVITEIPRWSESDPYNMVDQLNRFNCVLYESVNYGYDMYKKFYLLFIKYIQQSTKFGFVMDARDLLTYHYILKSMFPQFFSSDLVKMFDKRDNLLTESGRNIPDKNMSNCETDNGNSHSYISIATNEKEDDKQFETNSCEGNLTRPHTKINRVMVTHGYCDRDLLDNIDFSINFSQEKWVTNSNTEALQKLDENAAETVTRTQVTTTFDDTIPHITSDGEIEKPIEYNPFVDVTLDAFIKREWYLAEFDWTAAYTRTALATWIEPLITLKDSLKCKVNNVAYWAPDLELTFRINGTAMHYGRLMVIAVPSADTLHDAYRQPLNASQHRFVQLSPTGNQTVVMKLPWLHQLDRIPVYNAATNKTWTLYCWIAAPLQCANASVASPVTVQVFARVTNPRFSGYTHMITNSNNQMEQLTLSETAVQARAPKQTGMVEFVNTVAKDVTTLAGDMSQLASDIGFAVPASLKASVPINMRSVQLHKAEDLPPSIIMGESQAATVVRSNKQANSIRDGMHITKMAGRMVLLDTFKIAQDTAPGTKVMDYSLCPLKMFATDYEIVPAVGTVFPSPASYISRLFKYWRGSFKFHFSIISSAFHSMRLRMTYTPTVLSSHTAPTTSSAVLNVNELWDINNQTDYSFTIPYHYWSEWASMDDSMGVVYVVTQTKLSSIVATASIQPIYMQVWVGMDDDFQLACPRILPYGTVVNGVQMYNPDLVPAPASFTLEAEEEEDVPQKGERMITNSNDSLTNGNPLLNYKKDQFPAMSSDGLEKLHYPILGGFTKKHKNIRCTQSFEVSSIKELINMLSPIDYTLVTVTDPYGLHVNRGKKYRYTGFVVGNYKDKAWFNYFKQFKTLFRYYRGGVRMAAVVRHYYNTGKVSAVGYTNPGTIWDGAEWSDDDTDLLGLTNMRYLTHGCHYFADHESQPFDVTIPYHSSTKTTLNTLMASNPAYSFASSSPTGSLIVSVPQVTGESVGTPIAEINWFMAAADDGQFGYMLPVPRCRYAQS